jgi:hypothetical protein
MTYETVFDVSQRLPQLALGVVAAVALVMVLLAAFLDVDGALRRGRVVLGLGAILLAIQWFVVGEWPFVVALVVVTGVIVLLERAGDPDAPATRRWIPGAGPLLVGVFALILSTFQGLPMVAAIGLSNRLAAGDASVVEGPVTIKSFGKTECLTVETQRFCYSEAEVTPGYNRRQYLFGGLATGSYVRLSVIDGLIVRLEVRSGG